MAPYRRLSPEKAYETYADMLYRLAFAELSSAQDAEDAVADVFVKYLQSSVTFADNEHEKAWLLRVLINHCRDLRRKKSIRVYTPIEEVHHLSAAESRGADVLSAVTKLPEKNRTAMLLHYFEGYSLEETAKILRTTTAAVKMRLSRGRAALKNLLKGAE